jgi:adenylyltransferase/sulfurtransferase
LQRQTLFDEDDARQSLPKAVAAKRKLLAVNPECQIDAIIGDATAKTIEEWIEDSDVILDGTDNFETRFLINDVAVKRGIPWVYGGAVGSYGVTMTIRPGKTACLACVLAERPAMGLVETCDTLGILAVTVQTIAAIQASEAMKLLLGREDALHGQLISIDMWANQRAAMRVPERNPNCLACGKHEYVYLSGEAQPHVTMCGRDSVQIHERTRRLDLNDLRSKLSRLGAVRSNEFLLRFSAPPYELTVFPDGRAIIKGTRDPAVARSLYAKYLGG